MTRARAHLDLPLLVERSVAEPMSTQLTRQLRAAMREGTLTAGQRLPSSRAMATTLAVSRTVVMEAYEQLYAEGWLEGRHGSGTYVAAIHPDGLEERPAPHLDLPAEAYPGPWIDLRPGVPWAGGLDTPGWRRAWRLAGAVPPATRPDPFGLPGLRAAIADHMRRGRGVGCPAERVLVTRGATNGLDLLAATILRPGDRVGFEEPGYGRAASVLAARGAELVPCPVDEHGLVTDRLPEDLRLIYTTPSHQYPLGGVLPVPRRQALLDWARRTGALVAEDDYDGEFRYDVAPLPALYGLDPDVVVYLGTTAKTLAADVGVGWLVARPDLGAAIAHRREELNDRTPVVPQEAVRILIDRGDLDRHIRRMRIEYARRRALVVESLDGLVLRGDTAGMHLVVELPGHVVPRVIRDAAARGIQLDSLDRHYLWPPGDTRPTPVRGLVIGYGAARLSDLRTGCTTIRDLILGTL